MQWRAILERRLDPIAAMLTRRIRVHGNMLVLLRYVRSAGEMIRCASEVPTRFVSAAVEAA